jgi:3',5'-cyclic AMP phosphodiesterase CpdA
MLKLLILSDLHTHADLISDTSPSYISSRDDSQDPKINSLSGLLKFVQQQGLRANWIICPGDIAHQATPDAHSYAWTKLSEIRRAVGATNVFATVGNHDVDSRRLVSDFDPKSMLQSLNPPFPGLTQRECFQFWAENFYCKVDERADATLLLINSCAFHGLASRTPDQKAFAVEEYLYGRISAPTLARIRDRLAGLPLTTFNIVVVHHHVAQHPLLRKDVSLMKGNLDFLQELKNTQRRWLLIHGHLHLPALRYLDAEFLAPVVFSAGAAGAAPYPVLGEITPRNQFYLMELHPPEDVPGAQMRGIVHAWDWAPTSGWIPSREASGLPHQSGFGARPDLPKLASDIATDIGQCLDKQMSWDDLKASFPDLTYLLAKDCKDLMSLCSSQHNLEPLEQAATGNLQLISQRRS